MKTFCTILLLAALCGSASAGKNEPRCLRVSVQPVRNGIVLKDVTIALVRDNSEVSRSKNTSADGRSVFLLERNAHYTIKICRKGFITRKIYIDTSLPENVSALPLFRCDFQVEVSPGSPAINKDFIDYPIALVQYDALRDVFDYEKSYTAAVKKCLAEKEENIIVFK